MGARHSRWLVAVVAAFLLLSPLALCSMHHAGDQPAHPCCPSTQVPAQDHCETICLHIASAQLNDASGPVLPAMTPGAGPIVQAAVLSQSVVTIPAEPGIDNDRSVAFHQLLI